MHAVTRAPGRSGAELHCGRYGLGSPFDQGVMLGTPFDYPFDQGVSLARCFRVCRVVDSWVVTRLHKVTCGACESPPHTPHNCLIRPASSSHIETLDGRREKKLEVTLCALEEHWLFKIFGLCTLLPLMG